MVFGSGSSRIFVYNNDHAALEACLPPPRPPLPLYFDANAGFSAYAARFGDALYTTRSSTPGWVYDGSHASCSSSHAPPFVDNDVNALDTLLWAFWDECAVLREDESTAMVAVEAVYMLGATVPLRAMLYVLGRGMVALLLAKEVRACPVVHIRMALVASGGACLSSCIYELCGLYTATLLSSQPRARAPSTFPIEAVRVHTLSLAICVLT